MDTSWDSEPSFPERLRAIEIAATAVPVNRLIHVFFEFLLRCYAEHNTSVGAWKEHFWSGLDFHNVEREFYGRWGQGDAADLSSADQGETIFELCLPEMVARHNSVAAETGGLRWTLDNLKVLSRQFLVPCHYGEDCHLREVSHRHRPLPF
jgi:hypothetical protein